LRTAAAGLIAMAAAIGIGRFAFTPLLPMMQHDSGLTITAGGWLASANYLGYFAGAMSAVWMRAPPETMLRASMVLNALLIAGMGVTADLFAWVTIRAAAGVASAWVFVFASTVVIRRLAECARLELTSVMFAGVGIGILLPGVLCIAFVNAGVTAQRAWLAMAALAAAAAVMAWPAFGRASGPAAAADHGSGAQLRWNPRMASLIASYGLFGFGYIIPATFLPAFARDMLAGSLIYVWFWPVCGLAAAASVIASTAWSRRHGDYALLVVCILSEAAGVALPVFAPTPLVIGISAALIGGTFVVITMAALREARRLAPEFAGKLIAAMTSSFALGQIAGPVVAAHLVAWRGNFDAALFLASVALLAAVALLPASAPARH
jgi:predicted MFS family arabinose efflux permease